MRRTVVVASVVSAAIAGACADLAGLTGGGADAGSDAPLADAGLDASSDPPDGGATDSDVDPNGADAEAGLVDAAPSDAACGVCDCDGDGYRLDAADAACMGPAGDCDDGYAAVSPNAPFVSNGTWPSSHQPSFDWNCDGTVTKQLLYDFTCPSGLLGPCTGEGFVGHPGCGEAGTYAQCKGSPPNCVLTNEPMPRTQSCR